MSSLTSIRSSASLRQTLAQLPRDARDTLFLLVVIAWVIAPQVSTLPVWTTLLAAGVLVWRGWLAWHSRPLPSCWISSGLLAPLAVAGTVFSHGTFVGREAGVTLVIALLALKTLELRARRDALVIFFLGFFTMISSFFNSQSLLTAVAMLLALLGMLTALVNAHMPVGRPPLAQAFRTAFTMALLGAPIMAALFVLFPRMAPLWGVPGDQMVGRTGLSGSMQVGTIAELALSDAIAFRIKFDDLAQATPPASSLYFRGPVLSGFDGREWRAEPFREDSSWAARAALPANLQVQGPALRYEVTLEPHKRPWLMVLESTPKAPELPGNPTYMTQDLQWMTTRPVTDVVRYRAESYPEFRHGPTASVRQLREFTALPPGFNPRTLAWARSQRERPELRQADAHALSQAVLQHIRTDQFVYTLAPEDDAPAADGRPETHLIDRFWLDRRTGFCEHFATAYVVVMRGMGIPARVVTGFQGGELNVVDGFYVVRNSDAHAWAEFWQQGLGWVRIDPTAAVAPERVERPRPLLRHPQGLPATLSRLDPALWSGLRAYTDAANHRWNIWVLQYSRNQQMSMLSRWGVNSPDWTDLARVCAGLLVLLSLGGLVWLWWRRPRTPRSAWHRPMMLLHQALLEAGRGAEAVAPLRRAGRPARRSRPAGRPRCAGRCCYGSGCSPPEGRGLRSRAASPARRPG